MDVLYIQVNCCDRVFVFCARDIYRTSVRPRKKDPSSVFLPEIFPLSSDNVKIAISGYTSKTIDVV